MHINIYDYLQRLNVKLYITNGKRIVLSLFLLFIGFAATAQNNVIESIVNVEASINTSSFHPAIGAVDNDASSYWSLRVGETSGWISLELADYKLIHGIIVDADSPDITYTQVTYYDDNNNEKTFYTGLKRQISNGNNVLDFSYENIVTNKIKIKVQKNSEELLNISNIKIIGENPEKISHQILPDNIISGSSSSYYMSEYNMIDGNPDTFWLAERNAKWQKIHWAVLEILKERYQYNREDVKWGEGFATFEFSDPSKTINSIRLYQTEEAIGLCTIEIYDGSDWTPIASQFALGNKGWTEYLIPEYIENSPEKIRISLDSNNKNDMGGIGEIEFWGVEQDSLNNGTDISLPYQLGDTEFYSYGYFNWTYEHDYQSKLLCALSNDNQSNEIYINGEATEKEQLCSYLEYNLYYINLDATNLIEGLNFIEVASDVKLYGLELVNDSQFNDSFKTNNGYSDGFLFSKTIIGDQKIELNEPILIDRIIAYSLFPASCALYYLDDNTDKKYLDVNTDKNGNLVFSANKELQSLFIEQPIDSMLTELKFYGSKYSDEAPEVTVLFPQNSQQLLNHEPGWKVIAGTIDDTNAIVTIDGITAEIYGNVFWLELKDLDLPSAGVVDIPIVAESQNGIKTKKSIRLIINNNGYPITFDQDEIIHTRESTFTFSGSANKWTVLMKINGVEYPINETGFNVQLPLDNGLNVFQVRFYDLHKGDLVYLREQKVFKYKDNIQLRINSPENNYYTNIPQVTISGSIFGVGDTNVFVNNQTVPIINNQFSHIITLSEYENTIKVKGTDSIGSLKELTRKVFYDTTPPSIISYDPIAGDLLSTANVLFTGEVSDDAYTSVYINNEATYISNNEFTRTLSFVDGLHAIEIYTTDGAGNISDTINYTITTDTMPPLPFEVSATPSGWTPNTRPVIEFSTSDETSEIQSYEIKIDDGEYYIITSPYQLPAQPNGIHEIFIRATDDAGWTQIGSTKVYIDKTPPVAPTNFEVIPGTGEIDISWEKPEDDVIRYNLYREPEWSGEPYISIEEVGYIDTDVINGNSYTYSVSAIDHATNEGEKTEAVIIKAGLADVEYNPEERTIVEYQDAEIIILPGSLPPETMNVQVREVISDEAKQTVVNKLVSPILDFLIVDENGEEITGKETFKEPVIICMQYDESLMPPSFVEKNLGVYYYDEFWGRWFQNKNSLIDTETNTVYFTTDHFSSWSIQASPVVGLLSQETQDAGISPNRSYSNHGDLIVSTQGGGVKTTVSELVLPGPNGFDLVIARRYDLTTAKIDSRTFFSDWTIPYLGNQGDYTYSMGNGWRLNVPYIINSNTEQILVLPNGSMVSIWDMEMPNPTMKDEKRILSMYDRDSGYFNLEIKQRKTTYTWQYSNGSIDTKEIWEAKSYKLTLKNGNVFYFDDKGRLDYVQDSNQFYKIDVVYHDEIENDGGIGISYIEDAIGRKVYFEYDKQFISGFYVANDSDYNRRVTYTFEEDDDSSINDNYRTNFPLLETATDVGNRVWTYDHEKINVSGTTFSYPFNVYSALDDLDYEAIEPKLDLLESAEETHSLYALDELRGPGKGIIKLKYEPALSDTEELHRVTKVDVFTHDADIEKDNPQESVSYDFSDTLYTKLNKVEEHYLSKTVVDNGKRKVTYNFEPVEDQAHVWVEDEDGIHQYGIGKETEYFLWIFPTGTKTVNTPKDYVLKTRIKSRDTKPNIFPNPYRTDSYGYSGTSLQPISYTLNIGDDYEETDMAIDYYGNIVCSETISDSDGIHTKIQNNNVFKTGALLYVFQSMLENIFPGSTPPNTEYGDLYDSYIEAWGEDSFVGALSSSRSDIPLIISTKNYLLETDTDGIPINYTTGETTLSDDYIESKNCIRYNTFGQITGNAIWDSTNEMWQKSYYTYDDDHNLSTFQNANSHEKSYEWDGNNYLESITDKSVQINSEESIDFITEYSYDGKTGWKESVTPPNGYATSYEYDELGRVTAVTEPGDGSDNTAYTIEYDYHDEPTNLYTIVTDTLSRKTEYLYDDFYQLETIKKYNGDTVVAESSFTYNQWGKVESFTEPNGNDEDYNDKSDFTTNYIYDEMGRLLTIEFPTDSSMGNIVSKKHFDFDYINNVLTLTDEMGLQIDEYYSMQNQVYKRVIHSDDGDITYLYAYDSLGHLIATKDPQTGWIKSEYDSRYLRRKTILPEMEVFENGIKSSIAPEISYGYTSNGYLNEITQIDAAGGIRTIEKNILPSGVIRGIRNNYTINGTETEKWSENYTYNNRGLLYKVYDALNDPDEIDSMFTSYTYTRRGNIETVTDKVDNVTTYKYYSDGKIKAAIDPRGSWNETAYDKYTIGFTYNNLGQLSNVSLPPRTDSLTRLEVIRSYNPNGNIDSITDVEDNIYSYEYDSRNRLITESITGEGKTLSTEYDYNPRGNITHITNTQGFITQYQYDDLSRLEKIIYPEGNSYQYNYDLYGNVNEVTDGKGHATEMSYDSYGRVDEVVSPNGGIHEYRYDRFGNIVWNKNALDQITQFEYDSQNRLIKETTPDNYEYLYEYNKLGLPIESTDPNGTAFTMSYSSQYQLTQLEGINDLSSKTKLQSFEYDNYGNLLEAKDSDVYTRFNGYDGINANSYTQDAYGRILKKSTIVGTKDLSTSYGYDNGNRISSITYTNNDVIEYDYNSLGELVDVPGYLSESPEYINGLLKKITAANGISTEYEYDDNNRLSSLTYSADSEILKSYSYLYDNNNNIEKMNDNLYLYDEMNQLVSAFMKGDFTADVKDERQRLAKMEEDLFGLVPLDYEAELDDVEVLRLDYAASSIGVDLKNNYDVTKIVLTPELQNNRVIEEDIRVFSSLSNLPDSYTEVFDIAVNTIEEDDRLKIQIMFLGTLNARYIKVKTNHDDRDSSFNFTNQSEFYNSAQDLIRVFYNVNAREENYEYDLMGNRKKETTVLGHSNVTDYMYYPNANRLMSNGKYIFKYDKNGNILCKGTHVLIDGTPISVSTLSDDQLSQFTDSTSSVTFYDVYTDDKVVFWEYDYDVLNRMIKVSKNGIIRAEYMYDAEGLRVYKKTSASILNSTVETWYSYGLSGELLYKEDTNNTFSQYVYVLGRSFAVQEGTVGTVADSRTYLHTDHLGSVVMATDEEGELKWSNEFTPFGDLAEAEKNQYQLYTGKEWDDEAGLYYFNHRWYDPETGKFTSQDPIKDGLNWFAYCGNNPVNFIDSTGLNTIDPNTGEWVSTLAEDGKGNIDPIHYNGDKPEKYAEDDKFEFYRYNGKEYARNKNDGTWSQGTDTRWGACDAPFDVDPGDDTSGDADTGMNKKDDSSADQTPGSSGLPDDSSSADPTPGDSESPDGSSSGDTGRPGDSNEDPNFHGESTGPDYPFLLERFVNIWPVPNSHRITTEFGWDTDTFSGEIRYHTGIDIGVETGSPVVAPRSAEVISMKLDPHYGHTVVLKYSDGLINIFGHIDPTVDIGAHVVPGQQIATVADPNVDKSRGGKNDGGSHLHFELRLGNNVVDPTGFLENSF